ncbi:MAG: hypothetical protein M1832_005922 [Thelocarpon impressellum]|nr:MAG: hypothetical protein M1832_005922 [Thelocarpon impressellum]
MGSSQSKMPEPKLDEKLAESVRLLRARRDSSVGVFPGREETEGFVYVGADEGDPGRDPASSGVSVSRLEEWERELLKDAKNRLALAALSANAPATVLTSRASLIADPQTFNIKIPLEGAPITNQRASGRCWLFASTNVFRVALMRRHGLKEFELSQAYLFFWDKIEKANFFLEQVLDTLDEELDGRLLQALLASPVGDGGQWDMVANLVEKYGLVPQALYPDSFNAMSSGAIDSLITTKLREDALDLRRLASSVVVRGGDASVHARVITDAKARMVRDVHRILTLTLGPPPSPAAHFTWEYYDKDGAFHVIKTTPIAFAKELSSGASVRACAGTDVHKLFSLVNDPRNAYGELLSVSRLGNVVGGRGIRYVNVDMATIKTACIAMLRRGLPIFFGSDVGKYSNSSTGIMDTDLIDYELGFNVRLGMSKAQRLQTGESAMTHAMVLTAVHVVDGRPVRWRVQNSWGSAAGTDGWFVMSDAWMDEFVYQAVVDPAFVGKEVREVLDKEPKYLPLWDPMGALA